VRRRSSEKREVFRILLIFINRLGQYKKAILDIVLMNGDNPFEAV